MGDVFSKLTNLTILNIESNSFSGLVPFNALTVIRNLAQLHINENFFVGSIPSFISNFKKLKLLKIRGNAGINGTIPSEFGELTTLLEVHLSNNSISGSLPDSLYQLSGLTYLSFRTNRLSGTIPTYFGTFTRLEQFSLYDNVMRGTIPTELGNMTSLKLLILHTNHFNGTIPSNLFNIINLESVYLFNNSLTGPIPQTDYKSSRLIILDLSSNKLTGVIPSRLMNLPIEQLIISDNKLNGKLPEFVESICKKLILINLNNNMLEGNLPLSLTTCSSLESLYISSNSLSGSISSYFNHSNFPKLKSIDLSKNEFTGQFPSSVFMFPLLENLYMSLNCFRSFPGDSICSATNLKILVLDGLSVGKSCTKPYLSISDSYYSPKIDGTLPNCIFSLPFLSTVQISGIGLEGELTDQITLMNSVKIVRLSHNYLKGVIPPSFLRQKLDLLDLSSNYISGDWNYINSTSTELILYSNRLSGFPPSNANEMKKVNVLSGNIFACSPQRDVKYDINRSGVTCGSSNLDISLIVLGVVLVVLIISPFIFYYFYINRNRMKVSIVSKFTNIIKMTPDDVIIPKIFHCPKNSKIREFICLYFNMSKLIFITGFVILFLYIFLYGVMRGHGFDSHKFQYSWKYSGAYFYGLLPAVVIIFSSWVIFSMLMFYSRNLKLKRTTEFKYNNFNKSFRILSIVYTINIIVSVLADYFYVYTESSKGYSNTTKVLLQIFFSIWHVFWNLVAIPAILRILKSSPGIQFKGRLGCRLFNLIIASSVATMLADPLCYHYLLFSPPMTQYSYVIPKCIASTYSYGVITCTEEGFLGPYLTEFTPPFIYSRICYSAILTNYAPIIIYTSIFQLIFFPFIYIFPAKLLKKGKYALGLPQMLWPPDPDWSPPYYSSYLKIPKMLSSVFYYLALLLSFGILAPAVVVPVLLAFMSEIITFSYFLRRFLFMIVKYQDPSVKEIKVPIIEVLSIDT